MQPGDHADEFRSGRVQLVHHYDQWAPAMQNLTAFYDWTTRQILGLNIDRSSRVVDVGCGTGALLARLADRGFTNLLGIDFSPGCLELTRRTVQGLGVRVQEFDIEAAALPEQFDLVLMSTVVDFLENPATALCHVRESLTDNGTFVVTIRNRLAYFPWYLLRSIVQSRLWPARVAHWLQWFALPLPMRRTDQPFERIYSPREMRALLVKHGFVVSGERAAAYFPMLRIPGIPWLERAVDSLDRQLQRLPPTLLGYEYMFVCGKR